jgi:hypothetical protein
VIAGQGDHVDAPRAVSDYLGVIALASALGGVKPGALGRVELEQNADDGAAIVVAGERVELGRFVLTALVKAQRVAGQCGDAKAPAVGNRARRRAVAMLDPEAKYSVGSGGPVCVSQRLDRRIAGLADAA